MACYIDPLPTDNSAVAEERFILVIVNLVQSLSVHFPTIKRIVLIIIN